MENVSKNDSVPETVRDPVGVGATSVPMHMLELKDYKSTEAVGEIYHHRERLTGQKHATKATDEDHDDYMREIKFCKEEMNQALPSWYDNEVKAVAAEEGFPMIRGFVDLKKFYAKKNLYDDNMRRLVFLCQYGIFEPGRDAWLHEAESSFLVKKGWKYDTEEAVGNMTVKQRKDVSRGRGADGVGVKRREDNKQGRKKVGFVRHHFVRKKEDFCRALKTVGWKSHGEAITEKKKPKSTQCSGTKERNTTSILGTSVTVAMDIFSQKKQRVMYQVMFRMSPVLSLK